MKNQSNDYCCDPETLKCKNNRLEAKVEKLKNLIDSAFVAGRSKMSWETFYNEQVYPILINENRAQVGMMVQFRFKMGDFLKANPYQAAIITGPGSVEGTVNLTIFYSLTGGTMFKEDVPLLNHENRNEPHYRFLSDSNFIQWQQ